MKSSQNSTSGHIDLGPSLPASAEMRQALRDNVLPISEQRQTGDVVGLGALYRLSKKGTSSTGGFMSIYTMWTAGDAESVIHEPLRAPEVGCREDGTPVMHALRLDLTHQISPRLAHLANADIQSFDLICAAEGLVILRRQPGPRFEFIGAIAWDFTSNHQRLAFEKYVDTHITNF
jgi:hypothetical protein